MKQFYWVANNSRSVTNTINYIDIPLTGYTYQQGETYCIEYMELENPVIDLFKNQEENVSYTAIEGNYTISDNDLIRLRLISKEEGIDNYQDIFYGKYSELVNQQYLIFVPYITFYNGDILVTKISDPTIDLGYFPYQNLVVQETRIVENNESITTVLETTYTQHYLEEGIPSNTYHGFNVYKVENWLEDNQTIKISSVEKTDGTSCVLVVNNQFYSQEEFFNNNSFPDKVKFFSILKADGITTLPSGDTVDNTCVIINYE